MRSFAKSFYTSTAWANCREAYAKSKSNLCERCLKLGQYSPGEIVHHKVHLTPDNIGDARITLDWNNLELLCRQCHAEEHEEEYKQRNKSQKRYKIDEYGRVIATDTPPHAT